MIIQKIASLTLYNILLNFRNITTMAATESTPCDASKRDHIWNTRVNSKALVCKATVTDLAASIYLCLRSHPRDSTRQAEYKVRWRDMLVPVLDKLDDIWFNWYSDDPRDKELYDGIFYFEGTGNHPQITLADARKNRLFDLVSTLIRMLRSANNWVYNNDFNWAYQIDLSTELNDLVEMFGESYQTVRLDREGNKVMDKNNKPMMSWRQPFVEKLRAVITDVKETIPEDPKTDESTPQSPRKQSKYGDNKNKQKYNNKKSNAPTKSTTNTSQVTDQTTDTSQVPEQTVKKPYRRKNTGHKSIYKKDVKFAGPERVPDSD